MCAHVLGAIIESNGYSLKCAIYKPFCVTICTANNQTKLITIKQSNNVTFSITIRSADRQTKLDAIYITISFSQHNSISCTQLNSISCTIFFTINSANKQT